MTQQGRELHGRVKQHHLVGLAGSLAGSFPGVDNLIDRLVTNLIGRHVTTRADYGGLAVAAGQRHGHEPVAGQKLAGVRRGLLGVPRGEPTRRALAAEALSGAEDHGRGRSSAPDPIRQYPEPASVECGDNGGLVAEVEAQRVARARPWRAGKGPGTDAAEQPGSEDECAHKRPLNG